MFVLFRASQVALVVKNLPANAGYIRDAGSIPGSGRTPGGGHGCPFQYSCLENPIDRSLAGYSPWGHKESDTTEAMSTHTYMTLSGVRHTQTQDAGHSFRGRGE